LPPRRKSGRQFRDQNRWLAPPAECQRNTIYFVRSLGLDRAFPSPAFACKGISRLARSTCCQRPSALRTRRCASVRTTAIAACPRNLASLSSLQTRALSSARRHFWLLETNLSNLSRASAACQCTDSYYSGIDPLFYSYEE